LAIALSLAACANPNTGAGSESNPASATHAATHEVSSPGPAATLPKGSAGQPAPDKTAVLADSSAGLAGLMNYHAVVTIESSGSLDGQPLQRGTKVELTRSGNGTIDNRIQTNGGKTSTRLLALDGAFYRWFGSEKDCQGSMNPPGENEVIEPAALLLPLATAERVGVEMTNTIPSVHYRFDQSALPRLETTGTVSGEVWIAEEGGYVVRYQLSILAPKNSTGKGLEVSQTYAYDLTPISTQPSLPAGCAAVPVDLPTIDGAQNVSRASGLVSFDTSAKPAVVKEFYAERLPTLGWKAETIGPKEAVKPPVYFDYTQATLRLTVYLTLNSDQTTGVRLSVVDTTYQPERTPKPTQTPAGSPTPAPTIDPAKSGLPDNVPLYPGATSLQSGGNSVMFLSSDAWEDVAAFYRKELPARGWSDPKETGYDDGVSIIWTQENTMLILNITQSGTGSTIAVSLVE
jgi:hypothetical protein